MKKIFLCIVLTIAATTVNAQVQTLGLRIGGSGGAELSGQLDIGQLRLEGDLGSDILDAENTSSILCITAQYANEIFDNFQGYVGIGATGKYEKADGIFVGPTVILGIEYRFRIPIQIFLDYRPTLYLGSNYMFDYTEKAIGAGIRYRFGSSRRY